MLHLNPDEDKTAPALPPFEITLSDIHDVWLRYCTDLDWAHPVDESQKTLAIKKGNLRKLIVLLKQNKKWLLTPFTPEIALCKEISEKYKTKEDKLNIDIQIKFLELLCKNNPAPNTPAARALKPLKDKLSREGSWENIAGFITQLKTYHKLTQPNLTGLLAQTKYITPPHFLRILNTIRELEIETPAEAKEISALIPLPKSDIVAHIIRELRAAKCLHPVLLTVLTEPTLPIEDLANAFYRLRQDRIKQEHLLNLLREINLSNLTDTLCIFEVLRQENFYEEIANLLSILRDLKLDDASRIKPLILQPEKLRNLIYLIQDVKAVNNLTDTAALIQMILPKLNYLWDFRNAIAAMHEFNLDQYRENLVTIFNDEEYALELGDALWALFFLQEKHPTEVYKAQEFFNHLKDHPQDAYKIEQFITHLPPNLASSQNILLVAKEHSAFAWQLSEMIQERAKGEVITQETFLQIIHKVVNTVTLKPGLFYSSTEKKEEKPLESKLTLKP